MSLARSETNHLTGVVCSNFHKVLNALLYLHRAVGADGQTADTANRGEFPIRSCASYSLAVTARLSNISGGTIRRLPHARCRPRP